MTSPRPNPRLLQSRSKQTGASLFIALIILLLVTVLALSSTRETALESRITGNFVEQQRLANSAEAGLRDGENGMVKPIRPLEPTNECAEAPDENSAPDPCLLDEKPSYTTLFVNTANSRPYYPTDGTQPDPKMPVRWYAIPAPGGEENAESENPEYGGVGTGTSKSRYEINSKASNSTTNNATYMRSTTVKFFDNGDY